MEQHPHNTPNDPGKEAAKPLDSYEGFDEISDQPENPSEVDDASTEIVPPQSQEQRVEEARSELDEVLESTPDIEDTRRQENRNALNEGLAILNKIPPSTREYLFSKHNLPELMQPLENISQQADLDKIDSAIVSHLIEQIQQIGSPNPNSPIWQEIGRPSSSEMGRIAVRIEEALLPFLKHLQEVSQKQ